MVRTQADELIGTSWAGCQTPGSRFESLRASHFSLVANQRRGSVNRSPQGAIRGGFAVSPQNSGRFARCACCGVALARARRERRASAMRAAWDGSPALSPVPWGERSREAFNCVPGDQQSAPLVNSFSVCERAEPVDHRGDGSRRATNGARLGAWRTGRARFNRGRTRGRRRAYQPTFTALGGVGMRDDIGSGRRCSLISPLRPRSLVREARDLATWCSVCRAHSSGRSRAAAAARCWGFLLCSANRP